MKIIEYIKKRMSFQKPFGEKTTQLARMSEFGAFDIEAEEEEALEETPDIEQPEFEDIFQGNETELPGRRREGTDKLGLPILGKLAKARLIAARSGQLQLGAPPEIPLERLRSGELQEIALQEFEEGVLPIRIIRRFPDNTYEIWSLSDFKYRVRDEGRNQRARQRPFRDVPPPQHIQRRRGQTPIQIGSQTPKRSGQTPRRSGQSELPPSQQIQNLPTSQVSLQTQTGIQPLQLPQMTGQTLQMPQMTTQTGIQPLQLPQMTGQILQMTTQTGIQPLQLPQMTGQIPQMTGQIPQMTTQTGIQPLQMPQIGIQSLQMPRMTTQAGIQPLQLPQMTAQIPQRGSQLPHTGTQPTQMNNQLLQALQMTAQPIQIGSQSPRISSQVPFQMPMVPQTGSQTPVQIPQVSLQNVALPIQHRRNQ